MIKQECRRSNSLPAEDFIHHNPTCNSTASTIIMAEKTVVAFDLYGTLLSTESIANQLANHFGATEAQAISALWRRYQLEYTWRLNSMGKYSLPSGYRRSTSSTGLTGPRALRGLLQHYSECIASCTGREQRAIGRQRDRHSYESIR